MQSYYLLNLVENFIGYLLKKKFKSNHQKIREVFTKIWNFIKLEQNFIYTKTIFQYTWAAWDIRSSISSSTMNVDYKRDKKERASKLTSVNSVTTILIWICADVCILYIYGVRMIYCLFEMFSDKLFSTRMKNVITLFDMGFFPLLPLLICLFIDDDTPIYFYMVENITMIYIVAKYLMRERQKKEHSFCSMKITISDRR